MIVFYTAKKPTIQLEKVLSFDTTCFTNCIKPKSKCCQKYKKKGINCKRCPHILLEAAS